jgi:hypothetical protein
MKLSNEIPVFGEYPPSHKRERIKPQDLKTGFIENVEKVLTLEFKLPGQNPRQVINLAVKKSDFRKAIKHMRESHIN